MVGLKIALQFCLGAWAHCFQENCSHSFLKRQDFGRRVWLRILFLDLTETPEAIIASLLDSLWNTVLHMCVSKPIWLLFPATEPVGRKVGVGTFLKPKYTRIILWYCLNHRLDLVVGDAINEMFLNLGRGRMPLRCLNSCIDITQCSTAECERGFSFMNIVVYIDARNRLLHKNSDHVIPVVIKNSWSSPLTVEPKQYVLSWLRTHRSSQTRDEVPLLKQRS